jgi:hypothetical protein
MGKYSLLELRPRKGVDVTGRAGLVFTESGASAVLESTMPAEVVGTSGIGIDVVRGLAGTAGGTDTGTSVGGGTVGSVEASAVVDAARMVLS